MSEITKIDESATDLKEHRNAQRRQSRDNVKKRNQQMMVIIIIILINNKILANKLNVRMTKTF